MQKFPVADVRGYLQVLIAEGPECAPVAEEGAGRPRESKCIFWARW